VSINWDDTYQSNKRIWGEKPSELATFAYECLIASGSEEEVDIIDIGCGYGRDSYFLAHNLRCRILGIDNAEQAIEMARKAYVGENLHVNFKCCDFKQVTGKTYDVVFTSNLYQLLVTEDRHFLRDIIMRTLKPGGKLFLSALSTRDPEHFGKGTQVQGEENSYIEEKFLHFCTRKELERDFSSINIKELREHEYNESRSNQQTHHHISWLLFGIKC
jgi:2-polyprenyl-3-methyl-5-hydroxy-6-metoxy-1,4-benzoquinol methylase